LSFATCFQAKYQLLSDTFAFDSDIPLYFCIDNYALRTGMGGAASHYTIFIETLKLFILEVMIEMRWIE